MLYIFNLTPTAAQVLSLLVLPVVELIEGRSAGLGVTDSIPVETLSSSTEKTSLSQVVMSDVRPTPSTINWVL